MNSTLSSPCGDDVVRVLSEEIFIHPNYTSEEGLVLNDIAVIRLAHQVPLSGKNQNAFLAPKTTLFCFQMASKPSLYPAATITSEATRT